VEGRDVPFEFPPFIFLLYGPSELLLRPFEIEENESDLGCGHDQMYGALASGISFFSELSEPNKFKTYSYSIYNIM
jgi:NADH:ubiquinone oxidoreductase subunit H